MTDKEFDARKNRLLSIHRALWQKFEDPEMDGYEAVAVYLEGSDTDTIIMEIQSLAKHLTDNLHISVVRLNDVVATI